MTVTVTITLTDEQEAYARSQVESGAFEDIAAVVSEGLEANRRLRQGTHPPDDETLRAVLAERRKGPFISAEEFERRADEMFARKRREYGLAD